MTKKYKYVCHYIDRHGKPRAYYRRGGERTAVLPPIGSEDFAAAWEKANYEYENQGQIRKSKSAAAIEEKLQGETRWKRAHVAVLQLSLDTRVDFLLHELTEAMDAQAAAKKSKALA